jgi:hypothetical protein
MWSRHRLADVEALKRTKEDFKDVQKPKVKFRSKKRQYERLRQSPRIPSVGVVEESNVGSSIGAWLLARADDVATDLFVALQL